MSKTASGSISPHSDFSLISHSGSNSSFDQPPISLLDTQNLEETNFKMHKNEDTNLNTCLNSKNSDSKLESICHSSISNSDCHTLTEPCPTSENTSKLPDSCKISDIVLTTIVCDNSDSVANHINKLSTSSKEQQAMEPCGTTSCNVTFPSTMELSWDATQDKLQEQGEDQSNSHLSTKNKGSAESSGQAFSTHIAQACIAYHQMERTLFTLKARISMLLTENNRLKSRKSNEDISEVSSLSSIDLSHSNKENQNFVQPLVTKTDTESQTSVDEILDNPQSKLISELKEANQQWNDYLARLNCDHSTKIASLQHQIAIYKERDNLARVHEEKRQADIDKLLLLAKSQREAEERAKQEAVEALILERRDCRLLRDRESELNERINSLNALLSAEKHHVRLLQSQIQSPPVYESVEDSDQEIFSFPNTQSLQEMSKTDLKRQVQLLRTQNQMHQEDFKIEHQDLEKLQEKLATKQTELSNCNSLNSTLKDQLKKMEESNLKLTYERTKQEQVLNQTRFENNKLKKALQSLTKNICGSESTLSSQDIYHPLVLPPGPSTHKKSVEKPRAEAKSNWKCKWCTYSNLTQRSTCEMCGIKRFANADNMQEPNLPCSSNGAAEHRNGTTRKNLTKSKRKAGDHLYADATVDSSSNLHN